jgi:spore germination protein
VALRSCVVALAALVLLAPGTGPAVAEDEPPRNVAAWLPYWVFGAAVDEVTAHADLVDVASPFWFDAAGCRRIVAKPTARDASAVRRLHGRGLAVVPSVTAGGLPPRAAVRCFADERSRAAHVRALVRLAESGDYDGLDLDYEDLALTTDAGQARRVRRVFTAFVTDLCRALHRRDLDCSVTVMPRTDDEFSVWRGKLIPAVYDYAALAAVADEVRVMAYDQHAHEYGPGPVAGWPWVQDVATYAVEQMGADRLRLGVPTYARDFARGGHVSLTGNEARRLARRHHARIRWSPEQRESWFVYRTRGVRHEVWFSSPRAVAARVRLADRLGLRGSALWAAGLDAAGTWAAIARR